jgi:poly(A) polymerase
MVPAMQPLIIPRSEHGISRKQISPNALRTLYRLRDNGHIAYLVGGCVRDLMLSRVPKDFDIATDATPQQIKRLFRNCRLIGRRFRLAHLHFADEILEVSTFRANAPPADDEDGGEGEADQGHRPPRHLRDEDGMVLRDNVFGSPEQDALRRDFTVNALAYNIADFTVIDYTTGLSDLRQRLIRPIGDPFVRFTEDPVRMLRAVRFAGSHELTIEPAAWGVLCSLSATITRASPARLYEEMQKLFLLGAAGPMLAALDASGLLAALFPGLQRWLDKDSRHPLLLRTHLECLDRLQRNGMTPSPALLCAALFGAALEDAALEKHREGIPLLQALDQTCRTFLEEQCTTVCVPGRVGAQMRGILTMQAALHRIPPRRPAALVARPGFGDAMAYLLIMAKTQAEERRSALAWWESYVADPQVAAAGASPDGPPARRSGKRRHRHRRTSPLSGTGSAGPGAPSESPRSGRIEALQGSQG